MVVGEDSLVALAPFVLFLDLLHFFLGEVVLDIEVLEMKLTNCHPHFVNAEVRLLFMLNPH